MKNKIFKGKVVVTEDMISSTDTTISELLGLDKAIREAQIEEMAKVIRPILERRVDIGFIPALDKPIAEELVKQGYHKILPGFIVVDKEYLKKELQWLEQQVHKETAREILKEIDKELYDISRLYLECVTKNSKDDDAINNYGVMTIAHDVVVRVAKQFGVEVEE